MGGENFYRRGWVQHPYSTTSIPNGAAWLYCKGIPTLLEITEACRHSNNKRGVAADMSVGSVVATLVPVLAELVSTLEVCSTTAPNGAVGSVDKAVGAEQQLMGLLPLSNGDCAEKSTSNRSLVRLRVPDGYFDISVEDVCSPR
jgi:hypothetical protein